MRFKVRDVDIATGSTFVAIMNHADALEHELHHEDRIKIKKGNKELIAILDIAESERTVKRGEIGLMEEVLAKLSVKGKDFVEITIEKPPRSIQFIKDKLNGRELKQDEIDEIISDIVNNKLSQVEMTYFVSGCYKSGLSLKETVYLTKAIAHNGDIYKPNAEIVVDKHCIGGVPGNRTTMVVVPIVAAAGLCVPKTSSRSITSPAGTADTMEVLTDVCIPIDKLKKVVEKTNACMIWGGAFSLAAADDKLIRLRHPMSLDPIGMVLASVLAKKHAVSATHVLIDIPLGRGAKIEDKREANKFKGLFESIGKELGMKVKVIITDGSEPIGNGIGPALEARDVLWLLMNDKRQPMDLRKKSIYAAGEILEMAGKCKKGEGMRVAAELLDSGAAYKKMVEIIAAQGKRCDRPEQIELAPHKTDVLAKKDGKIAHVDNKTISRISWSAGAPTDKAAGMYMHKHKGDMVKKGEPLYTLYAHSKDKLGFAKSLANEKDGYEIQ